MASSGIICELGRIWKKAVVAYYNVPSQHSPGGLRKTTMKLRIIPPQIQSRP
jgi:hypothetical protein